MHIDGYIQALREDLVRIAAVGDESTARAGELLAVALESALARRLQEALVEAALELSTQLEDGRVEVLLAGGDPRLVYVDEAAAAPAEAANEVFSARITLRLSERLKARLEAAASATGLSVNAWLVEALNRAVEPHQSSTGRRRLTGYGRA